VIQRGEHLRFALEPRRAVGVERPRLRQDLDRHLAPELRVAGAVDLTHPAGTERGDNLVRSEAAAGCQRHQRVTGARRRSSSKKLKMKTSLSCFAPVFVSVTCA